MGNLGDQPRVRQDQGVAGVRVAGLDPPDQHADVPGVEPAVERPCETLPAAPSFAGVLPWAFDRRRVRFDSRGPGRFRPNAAQTRRHSMHGMKLVMVVP